MENYVLSAYIPLLSKTFTAHFDVLEDFCVLLLHHFIRYCSLVLIFTL